jgi:hypothetical protein
MGQGRHEAAYFWAGFIIIASVMAFLLYRIPAYLS